MTENKEREKRIIKKAIDILQGLHMAHKNIKLYDPNNRIVRSQLSSLFDEIQELLQSEGEVVFTLRMNTLYLNGIKVLFTFTNYYLFKYLRLQLSKREIGLIEFQENLDKDDLTVRVSFREKGNGDWNKNPVRGLFGGHPGK